VNGARGLVGKVNSYWSIKGHNLYRSRKKERVQREEGGRVTSRKSDWLKKLLLLNVGLQAHQGEQESLPSKKRERSLISDEVYRLISSRRSCHASSPSSKRWGYDGRRSVSPQESFHSAVPSFFLKETDASGPSRISIEKKRVAHFGLPRGGNSSSRKANSACVLKNEPLAQKLRGRLMG